LVNAAFEARSTLCVMTPEQELVRPFGERGREMQALQGLAGGVTATHLRTAVLTEAAFAAVTEGLADPNPRIRWWCVQLLDHVPDERAVTAVADLLDDPVPRVRRNAAHALGCLACKPDWSEALPADVSARLARIALDDPNEKVRREAAFALSCRSQLLPPNAGSLTDDLHARSVRRRLLGDHASRQLCAPSPPWRSAQTGSISEGRQVLSKNDFSGL
jgi:HEAT repeat protein